jgi:hypothetical protein
MIVTTTEPTAGVTFGRHRRPGLAALDLGGVLLPEPKHRAGTRYPRHRADAPVDSAPVTAWPKHRAPR